ncbi:hypothetical protein TNCT_9461 [Trichonephila clavata]|uniref:Uncharacterized protein n=1 Tax=Trichonephila clavata TaxID=2740835 RepID=A0A8X6GY54_TRICU|nr:hypothetical protein TNCT_9461 [Trichonephila clavata]
MMIEYGTTNDPLCSGPIARSIRPNFKTSCKIGFSSEVLAPVLIPVQDQTYKTATNSSHAAFTYDANRKLNLIFKKLYEEVYFCF